MNFFAHDRMGLEAQWPSTLFPLTRAQTSISDLTTAIVWENSCHQKEDTRITVDTLDMTQIIHVFAVTPVLCLHTITLEHAQLQKKFSQKITVVLDVWCELKQRKG